MGPSQPPEILSKQSGTHAASRALSQEGRGVGVGVDVDVDVDVEEEEETKLPDRHSIAVAKKNFIRSGRFRGCHYSLCHLLSTSQQDSS